MRTAGLSLLPALAVAAVVALAPASRVSAQTVDCEAARCAVQAAVAQNCPCDASTNHGLYVSCVARQVRQLAIPTRCRGRAVSCAARSTCGRPGAATCQLTRTGLCNATTSTCRLGTSATGTCAADSDCTYSRCMTVMSDQKCLDMGGVPGRGSCCPTCAAP
ncbi:MAG: hypothetical protein HY699_01025 [Deltaproteobacteria bacterium]|nr:hypothetical protein [Deltaproteobacteria bacterium]